MTLISLAHDSITNLVLSRGKASELLIFPTVWIRCVYPRRQCCSFFYLHLFSATLSVTLKIKRTSGHSLNPAAIMPTPKRSRHLSWRSLFSMTVPLRHTSNLTFSSLSKSLLKGPACWSLPSASGKQKCCFVPALQNQTAIHPSPSIEQNWRLEEFKYRGSHSLSKLQTRLLNQHNFRHSTKRKVYKTVVLTSHFYG